MWFIGKKIYIAVCNFFVVQQALWENCTFVEFLDVVVCLLSGTRQKKHLPSAWKIAHGKSNSHGKEDVTVWSSHWRLFFAVGHEKHTRKYLPCARQVAHGKEGRCVLCVLCHVLHTAKFQTFLFANIRLYYLLHGIVLYANQPPCANLRNSNFIT